MTTSLIKKQIHGIIFTLLIMSLSSIMNGSMIQPLIDLTLLHNQQKQPSSSSQEHNNQTGITEHIEKK